MTTPTLLPYPPKPTFTGWLDDDDMARSIIDNWRDECGEIRLANHLAAHAGPRIIGYCISFATGLPRDCGCGSCDAARAAGLALDETREVQA